MSQTPTGRTGYPHLGPAGDYETGEQSNLDIALEKLNEIDVDRGRRPGVGVAERQLLATEACAYLLKHIAVRMDEAAR